VGAVTESSIPKIYALPKAANVLGVSEHWLLMQIRKGRFVAMKRGRHSAMTKPQILAAIDAMTVPARESEPEVYPGGITRRSFQRRRRLIPRRRAAPPPRPIRVAFETSRGRRARVRPPSSGMWTIHQPPSRVTSISKRDIGPLSD
jgi:hypothetical protein